MELILRDPRAMGRNSTKFAFAAFILLLVAVGCDDGNRAGVDLLPVDDLLGKNVGLTIPGDDSDDADAKPVDVLTFPQEVDVYPNMSELDDAVGVITRQIRFLGNEVTVSLIELNRPEGNYVGGFFLEYTSEDPAQKSAHWFRARPVLTDQDWYWRTVTIKWTVEKDAFLARGVAFRAPNRALPEEQKAEYEVHTSNAIRSFRVLAFPISKDGSWNRIGNPKTAKERYKIQVQLTGSSSPATR
jgi:hypothetical protein